MLIDQNGKFEFANSHEIKEMGAANKLTVASIICTILFIVLVLWGECGPVIHSIKI